MQAVDVSWDPYVDHSGMAEGVVRLASRRIAHRLEERRLLGMSFEDAGDAFV
jgi:hypothetical protein